MLMTGNLNKVFVSLTLPLIFVFNCCNNKYKNSVYISKFYQNQSEFIHLVSQLRADTLAKMKFGENLSWTIFDTTIKSEFRKLDINSVHVFTWEIKQRQFDFIANWDTCKLLHIYYNTQDSTETKKGFYKKEGLDELWGLGDGWAIWTDTSKASIQQNR
jgi:hypothetical protein